MFSDWLPLLTLTEASRLLILLCEKAWAYTSAWVFWHLFCSIFIEFFWSKYGWLFFFLEFWNSFSILSLQPLLLFLPQFIRCIVWILHLVDLSSVLHMFFPIFHFFMLFPRFYFLFCLLIFFLIDHMKFLTCLHGNCFIEFCFYFINRMSSQISLILTMKGFPFYVLRFLYFLHYAVFFFWVQFFCLFFSVLLFHTDEFLFWLLAPL